MKSYIKSRKENRFSAPAATTTGSEWGIKVVMPHIFNPDLESGRIASRQSPGGPPCCNDRKGEQRKSAAAPQFRRVSDPAIRKQARSFAPGLFASILQTISPRTSPRGTPGSDGRCAKSKSSSDTRPGKLPYWYSYRSPVRPSWPPSPWRGGHPRHVPAAVSRATTHGRRRKHRRAVLTGRSAGTATDAGSGIHRNVGIGLRDGNVVGILHGIRTDRDEAAGLKNLIVGTAIHHEVLITGKPPNARAR